MNTVGKKVATVPFPSYSLQTEVKGGFAVAKQKAELCPLKVVFPCNPEVSKDLQPGDVVWVRADQYILPWAKEVFKVPDYDEQFILVPLEQILLVDRK